MATLVNDVNMNSVHSCHANNNTSC